MGIRRDRRAVTGGKTEPTSLRLTRTTTGTPAIQLSYLKLGMGHWHSDSD